MPRQGVRPGAVKDDTRRSARFVTPLVLGATLNPLNSAILAIANVAIARTFQVGVADVAWLLGGFYLAAAVAHPVAGRLADRVAPRRLFTGGLLIVGAASLLGALAPSLELLVAARMLQGIGSSVTYPSALTLISRREGELGANGVAKALGLLAMTSQVIGAVGPPLGGLAVGLAGWRLTLLVNLPVVLLTLVIAARWLPADACRHRDSRRLVGQLDPVGLVLLTGSVATLLIFLLGLDRPPWWALVTSAAGFAALGWWERRQTAPLIDVRMASAHPAVLRTLARNGASAIAVYGTFLGLPQWLQDGRGLSAGEAGLIMLPMCLVGVLCSLAASRTLTHRAPLLIGHVTLACASASLFTLDSASPPWWLAVISALFGVPVGLLNVGNQAAMYVQTPPEHHGSVAGLFRTVWYLGAVFAAGLHSSAFAGSADDNGLRALAIALAGVAGLLLSSGIPKAAAQAQRAAAR